MKRKILSAEHFKITDSYNNYAQALVFTGRVKEAKRYFLMAI